MGGGAGGCGRSPGCYHSDSTSPTEAAQGRGGRARLPTHRSITHPQRRRNPMASEHTMYVGEALVGEGIEIAHIDLLIGSKDGPVGVAFANALANQSNGHSNLLAVVAPNLICKPATVLITKFTMEH